ncbi:MAG: protein translocase subunit SecDF [Lentimicrobiaceae bacterium]|nr:protein translocase subunit SecDF [Lentimicrobiaceae bacterium]MDD4596649.1 protein translocase subunit SecDF [Lentimicrobiaceae bacterium]
MQNKGAIKFFAFALAIVCLFQLSFTFFSKRVENKAKKYAHNEVAKNQAKELAEGNALFEQTLLDSIAKARERYYLDSMSNETVYNILVRKYTYQEVKERELNLGLDLKGGMNVTLEVSVVDIVRALAGDKDNPVFTQAIDLAIEKQKDSQEDFVTLFGQSFKEVDPNASLAAIFNSVELKDRINFNSTNDQVLKVIREETKGAIDRTFNILRTRIDRFGVAQPNIQQLQTAGRILVELPGIKEPERVRKLLQGTAQLEFWETYQFPELVSFFEEANRRLAEEAAPATADTTTLAQEEEVPETPSEVTSDTTLLAQTDTTGSSLLDKIADSTEMDDRSASFEKYAKENPLFAYLNPAIFPNAQGQYYPGEGATVGFAAIKDTARVNAMLQKVKNIFPRDMKLMWTVKPEKDRPNLLELMALKVTSRDREAPLGGDAVIDARQDYDQNGRVEITMLMNSEGAKTWKRLTGDNIGKQIAIVLDNYVYSAPRVNNEIPNGRSSISGNFTVEEALDLANILKAGKLPAPARIVQEEVVGPSLGRESINSGLASFVIAFILVLIYMVLYYNRAGWIADLALVTNIFFIFGVLTSLGAVLTLPGIAGIVLTLGMAVDANVIIYERIREEIRAGKGIRLAITDGYQNAYSAIIDGNVTTLLTGIVLYIFGSGPVQGFATTLIIGIITSLFTAIFISRVIFENLLSKNKKITFDNQYTRDAFSNVNFNFVGMRKKFYIASGILIVIGVISLATKGLNFGVDFTGGRTYVVRFDKPVSTSDVREALQVSFDEAPEVKTFGSSNQVKITTKYMIDQDNQQSDSIVEAVMFNGLKDFYSTPMTFKDFTSDDDAKVLGRLSSQKVGPTIADDIKKGAILAVFFALIIIFIYIAIRFKRWQFGVGGLISLAHDTLIALSLYSIFSGILPFNLEVDQAFIAALLTIIGYSINDTVVIFDRIREYIGLYPKRAIEENMNNAMNSTLGRTFNTSGTTLVVLLAIFVFGGEVIRGFIFALMVGIAAGTYSSLFMASPLAYDFIVYSNKRKKLKADKKKNVK